LCVAGIVGVWSVREEVTERTTHAFQVADRALDVTARATNRVHESLQNARDNLRAIRVEEPEEGGGRRVSPEIALPQMLARRMLAQQIAPHIEEVRQTVNTVTEVSVVLNSLLEGVNELPIGSSV